ncbi:MULTISPECIES: hypothetical protein [unclassified Neorhizobium]|uniref:hypothetical protein n=1 Tax=unclassified Neorhizobium TaxID=2629175 RepID=UPI001FF6D35F|nr:MULTISPECIES: hypothetical protein [unclassified Neorhizobium]MCJ9670386.1 hypothetical protein [Neorhizobium sp. SHOUNA12B]MCJ9746301.1 hypothetical protein [Neorhizobium sp. SHOUNA12A]
MIRASAAAASAASEQATRLKQYLLVKFASSVVAVGGDKVLAGAELLPGNVAGFMEAMGIPADDAGRNDLLDLAKVTASEASGDSVQTMQAYAGYDGVTANGLAACHKLKDLCENGLPSLSERQRKLLMKKQRRVLTRIGRLLHKDPAAMKLVQTLAGMGFFTGAAWLQWGAQEKAWKIGSWSALCIGAIRLLGNLMYNEAGAIHQGWKIQYTHCGMAVVSYAMEILTLAGVEIVADKTTMVVSTMANLVPILGYYMRNMQNTFEERAYKFERSRSNGPSEADAAILKSIIDSLQAFSTKSADTLAVGSTNRPGNRAAATAKEAEIEVDTLADLLLLEIDPNSGTWTEFFKMLLREAIAKAPSLIFALATGAILVAAAVGNVKALSDNVAILMTIVIEIGLGVKNPKLTAEQMQYRLLVLILSRFGSVFFFAARMIHEVRATGRRDIYDREPGFAAVMAHCNAVFVCVLGLAVAPSIIFVQRLIATAAKRMIRCCVPIGGDEDPTASSPGDELDETGRVAADVRHVSAPLISFPPLDETDEGDEGLCGDEKDAFSLPGLIWVDADDADDPEAGAMLDELSKTHVFPALEEFASKFEDDGAIPVSFLEQIRELAALTGSNQID